MPLRKSTKAPASISGDLLATKGGAAPQQQETAPAMMSAPKVGRISLTFRVTPDMHEQLRTATFERRLTLQDLLEQAVESYLNENPNR